MHDRIAQRLTQLQHDQQRTQDALVTLEQQRQALLQQLIGQTYALEVLQGLLEEAMPASPPARFNPDSPYEPEAARYQPRVQCSIQTASQRLGGGEEHVAPTSAIPCVAQPHFTSIGHKIPDTLSGIRSPETNELKTLAVDQHRGCGSFKYRFAWLCRRVRHVKVITQSRAPQRSTQPLRPTSRCRLGLWSTVRNWPMGLSARISAQIASEQLGGEVQETVAP